MYTRCCQRLLLTKTTLIKVNFHLNLHHLTYGNFAEDLKMQTIFVFTPNPKVGHKHENSTQFEISIRVTFMHLE